MKTAREATAALVALAALGVLLLAAGAPSRLDAKVFASVREVLEIAFPSCTVERSTIFLTPAQLSEAGELAGTRIRTSLVHAYVAHCESGPGGTAYFDTHRVRTLPETLMVVVDPDDRVARIEILSFSEPEDYIPREAWYDQFIERPLDDELNLRKAIRPVTGATLTARATADAVRRVLALHEVTREEDS